MAEQEQTQKTAEEIAAEQSLENFDWDETGEGDFFGIADTAKKKEETETEDDKIKKEAVEASKKKEEESKEEDEKEDVTFFETSKEGDEDDDDPSKLDDDYKGLASKLKDKGIFQNIEIPDEEEITEEKFIEFQDEEIESRVEEALKGFIEELDGDAAEFLQFKKDGGKTKDFFSAYSQSSKTPSGDIDDEEYQEKISRYYYSSIEGMESEDIDSRIEWLKDSGKLAKYAEKQDTKIKNLDKKAKEDLQKSAKQKQKLQQEAKEKFVSTVKKTLDTTDEVDSFTFNSKEKKELLPFITKSSIKVGENTYYTGMQVKLRAALKDPAKMLVLAKLLKNDFDVSDIVAATTTTQTKKVKKTIQRAKTVVPKSSGKSTKRRNLADFF